MSDETFEPTFFGLDDTADEMLEPDYEELLELHAEADALDELEPLEDEADDLDELGPVKSGVYVDSVVLPQNISGNAGNTGRKYAQVLAEKSPAQRRRMPKGVRFS